LIVIDVSLISRTIVPLICYVIVESHQAGGVMRQFRFWQNLPSDPMNLDDAYRDYMRGRKRNWQEYHQWWITMWNDRHIHLVQWTLF